MADVDYGDASSGVAICCFWTDRKRLLEKLDRSSFALIGQLYSSNGINYLLQTLRANTQITTLVLFGHSLTRSDEDLVRLWQEGSQDGRIPGTKVQLLLPPGEIDLVRSGVRLVDLRKQPSSALLDALRETLASRPYTEPKRIAFFEEEKVETLPSPLSGHHIYEESVFAAWVKLLNYIMKFGELKRTEYGDDQKEYNNVMVTVGKHHEFLEMGFKGFYSDEELDQYYRENILYNVSPESRGISYTYGQRLFDYDGKDQVEHIIAKLGAVPYTRRAVAVLWKPGTDPESEHAPCLNLVSCNIHGDKVYMSVVFRSNDAFGAWYKNVLSLMRLQQHIAMRINERFGTSYGVGSFTIDSISAHIYKRDFGAALRVVEENLAYINRLNIDPKGLFVVNVTPGRTLEVEYRSNEGELLQRFSGRNGEELYKAISNNDIFSFFVHSAYLGYQISKAENCIRLGIEYVQDKAPDA